MKSSKVRTTASARRSPSRTPAGGGRRRAGRRSTDSKGSRNTGTSGRKVSSRILLPLVSVGALALVILAGLVFWGLESRKAAKPATDATAAHRSASTVEASKSRDSAPPPREMNTRPEKPTGEVPHASARAGVENTPPPQTSAAKINGGAAPAPVSKSTDRGEPPKEEKSARSASGAKVQEPGQNGEAVAVDKSIKTRESGSQDRGPEQPVPPLQAQGRDDGEKSVSTASSKGDRLALNWTPPPGPEVPANSLPPKFPPKPPLARVAIVIDDLGQDLDMATKLASIPLSITFSVMPFQKHSKEVLAIARAHQRETMLHMPMEPDGYPRVNPGEGALLISMSSQQIQQNLETALDAVTAVGGINNHMGSRFTQNAVQMGVVMKELHRRGLFFLDSATTANTVALDAAQRHGVPYMRRDIFLDHVLSESFVKAQLVQLIRRAKVQGSAVGIGHPHQVTLNVLRQESSLFERENIAVVPAGQLLQKVGSKERSR